MGVTPLENLPKEAKEYVSFLEKQLGVPIDIVSTGPDREETLVLTDPFA